MVSQTGSGTDMARAIPQDPQDILWVMYMHQTGPLLLPQLLGMLSGGCAEWLWEGGPNQEPSKWRGQENGGYAGECLCVDLGKEKEAARKV